jgi:hypothetical protein
MFTRNKFEILFLSVLLLLFCISRIQAQAKAMGEPVPGAEIYIELEPDDEPIANVTTNENGEFEIIFSNTGDNLPNIGNLPSIGIFVFTIKPSKYFSSKHNIDTNKLEKIRVKFNKSKGKLGKKGELIFKYEVRWDPPTKTSNKGAFAVSGKNST